MAERELRAHIVIDEFATDDEIEALRLQLAKSHIDATIDASYEEDAKESLSVGMSRHEPGVTGAYPAGDRAWTMLIHVRINDLARRLGDSGLRDLVESLRSLRGEQTETSPANGLVFLVDEETGVRLDLDFQLPLRAYSDLAELRISSFLADPVQFHRKSGPHGRWRAPH